MKLFGYEFKRTEESPDVTREQYPTFTPKATDDGAITVTAGGFYGTYVDLSGTVRTEAELISRYRDMSLQPECDMAIDEIVNEALSTDEEHVVSIILDNLECSDDIKQMIRDEFDYCVKLLNFNKRAYEIFRRWYVDGQLFFHPIIDEKAPKDGIKEMRNIDPRKIRKIREVKKVPVGQNTGQSSDVTITQTVNEYFIYNERGFDVGKPTLAGTASGSTTGLRIAKDSVIQVVSGLTDVNGQMVLSYLHKGIKSLTQLRTLEDALVIYRLARAPERRVWYVAVGNMPKMKQEQYMNELITKHKNRLVYDAQTGDIRDDRKFITLLEDYWLPVNGQGQGTKVETLKGGETLGQMDDVLYFQKKFLNCLNVPVSRLNSDSLYSLGRATEITRDEIKFSRFVNRLKGRFSELFNKMLEKQLVLKQVMSLEDWQKLEFEIRYEFANDTYFDELKEGEILESRLLLTDHIQPYLNKYYSNEYVRKEILKQTDEDIEQMDEEMREEEGNPQYANPMDQMMTGMPGVAPNGPPGMGGQAIPGMPPMGGAGGGAKPGGGKAKSPINPTMQTTQTIQQIAKKRMSGNKAGGSNKFTA